MMLTLLFLTNLVRYEAKMEELKSKFANNAKMKAKYEIY